MALGKDLIQFSKLCSLCDFTKLSNTGSLKTLPFTISVRATKHWNPKFKWLRAKKTIPVELPHTEEFKKHNANILKDMGIFPRHWRPRPMTITTASEILDPYKPPDGDGKSSNVSEGVVERVVSTPKSKITDTLAMRKIKKYDPDFNKNIFLQEAHDIYVTAHTTLMKKDPEELSKYVTERANVEMMNGVKNNTIHWKFIESLEPSQLIQSRVQEVFTEKNLFAQLTVRFHTKQCLAIYDRFGRLICGSEILAKDVLEYVVFEKHINNEYGIWRLHAKIIPEWKEPLVSLPRTYRMRTEIEKDDDDEDKDVFIEEDYPESGVVEDKATSEIIEPEAKALK